MLNRIVLGGIGGIVRDSDLDAQGLRQLFLVLFEEIGPGLLLPPPSHNTSREPASAYVGCP